MSSDSPNRVSVGLGQLLVEGKGSVGKSFTDQLIAACIERMRTAPRDQKVSDYLSAADARIDSEAGYWYTRAIDYSIEPPPIPEPTSWMLLGSHGAMTPAR